jgi:predicted regulator of Ras-like GTPase activity (Roadblock/LC7/MglB family)
MSQINYEKIITQLKTDFNAECAIANKYGVILESKIKEFFKGKIIPQRLLSLISNSSEIAKELKLDKINSFAIEAQQHNYLFTFTKNLILISKLELDVNLGKFMPNISVFLKKLSDNLKEGEIKEFSIFDFGKELKKIEITLKQEEIKKGKYSIIKDLVKYVSSKL